MQDSKNAERFAGVRHGVTLIELLIVMSVLTILATLSLTTVKGLLKDQKIASAGQLVSQYFETARVRALTNGRPVAVFMDRVAVVGDGAGNPIPGNFTANRLSIGEVFPPYTGDVISASGSMWDVEIVNMVASDTNIPSRHSDGFADQIRFSLADVAAGFGPGGFVSVGDTIEFEGYNGRFAIESVESVPGPIPQIAVTFFNPPEDYNRLRLERIKNGVTIDSAVFEATHARVPPQIPVSCTSPLTIDNANPRRTQAMPPGNTTTLCCVKFRVYRRPTKSLVGAVTLPRGTCIDFSASGFGSGSAGAGDGSSPFWLGSPPMSAPADRSSYSRIAVLFSAEGRLSSVVVENNVAGTKFFGGADASQVLNLMVGRTEQVMPGDLTTEMGRKLALLTRTAPGDREEIKSNLLDTANTWISCNPFTGEVKSSPVAQVPDALLTTAVNDVTSTSGSASIAGVVAAARSLSTVGVRN